MIKSESITKISADLLKAQSEMSTPVKDAKNPYFNSKYVDLNAILDVSVKVLNDNNISLLQPVTNHDGRNYVQTLLLHSSGEFLGGETEIKAKNPNDPQAEGSGITYARRYGLQSLLGLGAEDDDGTAANKPVKENNSKVSNISDKKKSANSLPDWLEGKLISCNDLESLTEKRDSFIAWAKEKNWKYKQDDLDLSMAFHIDRINGMKSMAGKN